MIKLTNQEEYGWYGLIWTNAMLKLCCFRKSCWPFAQPKPPWKPSRKLENGHWTAGICRKSWYVGRSSTTFHNEFWSNLGTNRNLNLRRLSHSLDRCPIRLGRRSAEERVQKFTMDLRHLSQKNSNLLEENQDRKAREKQLKTFPPAPHATTWNHLKPHKFINWFWNPVPASSFGDINLRSWILGTLFDDDVLPAVVHSPDYFSLSKSTEVVS